MNKIQIIILSTFMYLLIIDLAIIRSQHTETFPVPGIEFAPKQYVCYRTNVPLTIDGELNEPIWQQAAWTDNFVDIEGSLKPEPRFKTQVKMLWDDHFFYIAAELEEPHVWANLKERDAIIFYDNDFEVFIDPDGDSHEYYELEVNAFATEWDLLLVKPYRDGGPAVHAWDIAGLTTGVAIDGTINDPKDQDKGWTVEIAMPWLVLKECAHKEAPPIPGDQWRVNFSRVEWQVDIKDGRYAKVMNPQTGKPLSEDNWVWSPQGLINMHYPEMWGRVQFSDRVAGTGVDEFVPNPVESAKWALRQLYYRQRQYFINHHTFTNDISELNLTDVKIVGYQWPPEIKCTWNLFEAKLKSTTTNDQLYISRDGRVVLLEK